MQILCLFKVCVCLNKGNPWFEIGIRFNWYGNKSFQRALALFISLWFYLILREFNYVSMFKMSIPPLQMESCTKCLGAFRFLFFLRKFYILLSFLLKVLWIDNIMYLIMYLYIMYILIPICILWYISCIWPICHSFDERIWVAMNFFLLKESLNLFQR